MPIPNAGNTSGFNAALYDGFIESIRRRALELAEQQRQFPQDVDPTWQRDALSFDIPNSPLATLSERLAGRQAGQKPAASDANRVQTPQASLDPNFRRLVRTSPAAGVQSPGEISVGYDDLPNPSDFISGLSSQLKRPALTLAGFRTLGRTLPPPPGPGTIPSFPVPPVPETWKFAWPLLRSLPEVTRDLATGDRFGFDQYHEQSENGSTTLPREKQEQDVQPPEGAASPKNSERQPQGNDKGPPAGLLGLLLRLQQYQREQQSTSGDSGDEDDELGENIKKILAAKKERENKKKANTNNGGGSTGSGGRGNEGFWENYCDKRYEKEQNECYRRWGDGEYAHKDFYRGCLKQAELRWIACNAGKAEPEKWRLDPHEEISINTDR